MGQFCIHELGRTLVRGNDTKARELFTIVSELDPVFHKPPDELFKEEIVKLRTGAAVLSALDRLNQTLTRSEILNMSRGSISEELRRLIEERDADKEKDFPRSTAWYLDQIESLRRQQPNSVPKVTSLQDIVEHFAPDLPRFVEAALPSIVVRTGELQELAVRIDSFPAIRAHVRGQFYLMLIVLRDRRAPRLDKLDDYRHVVEAAYCDVLVTDDRQLQYAAPQIHPDLKVLTWEQVRR